VWFIKKKKKKKLVMKIKLVSSRSLCEGFVVLGASIRWGTQLQLRKFLFGHKTGVL
jgi:hypothetical protein